MNPGASLQMTGVFPICRTIVFKQLIVSASVYFVFTISTSFITGAGLKKCRPANLFFAGMVSAMDVTDSEDVFVTNVVSGSLMDTSSFSSDDLTDAFSTMASITRLALQSDIL